ncbi:MAG: HigA family addiction module antitoxin [Candidatus Anammoxibacter sp.]
MSRMHNPPHPGEILSGLYIEPADLSISEVARNIGVDRKTLSRIINAHASITVEMAIKLAKAFSTTPELWLNAQQSYDLWQAERTGSVDISRISQFRLGKKNIRQLTHI